MVIMQLIIVGCGQRGTGYSLYAIENPEKLQVIAVAEPNDVRRNRMIQLHNIPKTMSFIDWKAIIERPKFADAVVIATQDRQHCEPAVAFANAGYHILLEKPMAPSVAECQLIFEAVRKNNIMLSVGHVLRYTALYRKLKMLIDEGTIGEVVSINHMENIGYFHFAHSFVRGNWRNEAESTFSLLAKSCHDLDLIIYFMNGASVSHVCSFGSLNHFMKSKKPKEAASAKTCLTCSHEPNCPYSAKKIYLQSFERGNKGWPVSVVTDVVTEENLVKELENGPYGRCVYECDNDVADQQVVSIQFADGRTATFSMVAFTEDICVRKTRIFGSMGELVCDGHQISLFQFNGERKTVFSSFPSPPSQMGGHFGGDFYLMEAFVKAVSENNPAPILSGPEETLASHLLVFAAEQSRRSGQVVDFQKFICDARTLEN